MERWVELFNTLLNQPTPADLTALAELPELPTLSDLDFPPKKSGMHSQPSKTRNPRNLIKSQMKTSRKRATSA